MWFMYSCCGAYVVSWDGLNLFACSVLMCSSDSWHIFCFNTTNGLILYCQWSSSRAAQEWVVLHTIVLYTSRLPTSHSHDNIGCSVLWVMVHVSSDLLTSTLELTPWPRGSLTIHQWYHAVNYWIHEYVFTAGIISPLSIFF